MKKILLTGLALCSAAGMQAQQDEEGLVVDRPTTITDVSPYQGTNVSFTEGGYFDEETYDYINSMGSITLDAPSSPRWQIGRFTLPINFFSFSTIYDYETLQEKGRVNKIGTFLNQRTPVEANEVLVRFYDPGYDEWLFFSVPFDVNVDDIRGGLGQWVIRRYSGEKRAAARTGETWVDVRPGEMLHAGEGYIFMRNYSDLENDPDINWEEYEGSEEDYCLILPAAANQNKQNLFRSGDVVLPLKHFSAERSTNADWNMLGNPYPCYYDVSAIPEKATLYVWDYNEGIYRTLKTGEHSNVMLAPGQPFFVQAEDLTQLTFPAIGRRIDGRFDFPAEDEGDDDEWGDDEWGDDDIYANVRQMRHDAINKVLARHKAAAHGPSTTFNPMSPYDPGANYFNPATGEVVFDMIPPGGILKAAVQLFGGSGLAKLAKSVTILAPPGEFFMLSIFTECERVDMSQSWGFTTVPDRAFFGMMKLREVVLPSCVTAIVDNAFQYCMALEQLDIYATTPPKVTQNVFNNMRNNLADMIVRVPEEAVEAYKQAEVWKNLNIQALKGGSEEQLQGVTISVVTPEGEDIASQCNIVWRNDEGNVIGVGRELTAQTVGTTVSYSIGLPASLINTYETVPDGRHTVAASGNNIRVQLIATGVIDLGSLNLQGSQATLTYNYVPSSNTSNPLSSNDVQLTVTDKATGTPITDGICQDTTLIFQQTRLNEGQTVTVRATSRSGLFAPAEADATADADGNIAVTLTLREYGHARLVCSRAEGVTDIMTSVYDAAGNYVARFTDNGSIITVSGLPDGAYTAIVMQQSQFFNVVSTLADLQQTTLHEGTDYGRAAIELTAGTSRDYQVNVPVLDESALSHLTAGSYLATQNTSITLMQTATLKAKVIFKPEYETRASNVQLLFDIPEGLHYQQGYLVSIAGTSQLSGRRLVVPTQPGEQVKFCVTPDASGTYTVNAIVQYIMDGHQYTQPVGSAVITVEGISLNLVATVNTPDIHIHGYAFGNSHITFYDGERVIGETTAKIDGRFDADVRLTPDCDDTHHSVYALIDKEGQSVMSEVSYVTYDKDASMVQAVSMIYQDHRITWNMQKGTVSPNYYNVNPELSSSTTFQAKLLNPQPDKEMNPVFIVGTSDGLGYELPAEWDEASQTYIATTDFDGSSYCLPTCVEFHYDYVDPSSKNRSPLLVSDCRSLVSLFNTITVAFDKQLQVGEILEDSEDRLSFTFTLANRPGITFMATAQIEDADDILGMREEHEFIRYGDETKGFTTYVEDDGQSLKLYIVDLPAHEAVSVVIGFYGESAESAQSVRGPRRVSFFGIVNGIGDFAKMLNPIQATLDFMDDVDLSDEYRREMHRRLNMMQGWCLSNIRILNAALAATCPNGEPRVPSSLMGRFSDQIGKLEYDAYKMVYEQMPAVRELFERAVNFAIGQHVGAQVIDAFGGKIIKAGGKILRGGKVLQKIGKISEKIGSVDQIADALESAASDGLGKIAQELMNRNIPKDFKGIKQYYDTWTEEWFNDWRQRVRSLHAAIVASYDCGDTKPHGTRHPKTEEVTPIVDPSGYVYEGVENNRVEGVTATIYFKEDEGAAEQLWDAAEFGQENPQLTDAAGLYMWNVPKGLWQVRFEKNGYELAQTEWLPVPPPQLEIAVPMIQTTQPEVTEAAAYSDAVSIRFSKYMQTETLSGITVRQNGSDVGGTLEYVNAGNGLASHVRFLPDQPFTAAQVELNVPAEAQSYAGIAMGASYSQALPVQHVIEGLIVQEDAAVELGQQGYVMVTAYPAQAVSGKALRVSFRSPLLELGGDDLTFDADGQVMVPFNGLLPGEADVTFGIGDLEVRCTVQVKYHLYEMVARPIATILSGSEVPKGTQVELYCATRGATIYYTTDGSCPCDEATRILYTGPITITEDVTIRAIAVCEGMTDSEVFTVSYTVGEGSSIADTAGSNELLGQDYYDLNGQRAIPPLRKGVYIHVRRTTTGTQSRKVLVR